MAAISAASPKPSPLKSPAEATEKPKKSLKFVAVRMTSASASARLVPVVLPKKIKALPDKEFPLLSSPCNKTSPEFFLKLISLFVISSLSLSDSCDVEGKLLLLINGVWELL